MNNEKKQHGVVQWVRDVMSVDGDSLAPYRDRIMLSMSLIVLVLLLPFTINHLLQARWLIAAMLSVALIVTLIDTRALLRGQPPPIPYTVLLVPFLAGICLAIPAQGAPVILWVYPVALFVYFVLPRGQAMLFNAVLLLAMSALVAYVLSNALALRLFSTLLLMNMMINVVLNVIADLHQTLIHQALTDPLTGAYNRRYMEQTLALMVVGAQRQPLQATLLMIDIDHFKQVNDQLGHDQGDHVLQQVVLKIRARMRQDDRLFRWGGEEFLLLLDGTSAEGGWVLAEDIRQGIAAAAILPGRQVTVSIGVSAYQAGHSVEAWTKAADLALYRAKASGRNCVQQTLVDSPLPAETAPG